MTFVDIAREYGVTGILALYAAAITSEYLTMVHGLNAERKKWAEENSRLTAELLNIRKHESRGPNN